MKKRSVLFLFALFLLMSSCGNNNDNNETNTSETNTNVYYDDSSEISENNDIEKPSTINYELNGVSFEVPDIWIQNEQDSKSDLMKFEMNDNENSLLLIRYQIIPEIMKIDVDDNSILSKEDVVDNYKMSSNGFVTTDESYKTENNIEYFNQLFDDENNNRIGRCVIVPINENYAVFQIVILCEQSQTYLDDADVILSSFNIDQNSAESINGEESITYNYYNDITTLTKDKLSKSKMFDYNIYSYNDIEFIEEDCDWIDDLSDSDTLDKPGVFYRKMAKCLEGFYIGNKWSSYAEHIIGFTPKDRDTFASYVDELSTFIVSEDKNPLESIMKKFDTLNSVDGTFNFESSEYNFTISDLTACADELQISEEMLSYIFARLKEYDASIEFDGNTCHFSY